MFLLAAALIRRSGSADIARLGGFGGRYPVMYSLFLVALFSLIGLPGLNGFVGEFLVLLGAFRATPAFALVGLLGVVLAATVLLWMFRLSMQGPTHQPTGNAAGRDLTGGELIALAPLVVLIIALGLVPNILLSQMEGSVGQLVAGLDAARQQASYQPSAISDQLSAISSLFVADQ